MNPTLIASLIIFIGATAWGVYWIPVRTLEEAGLSGGWAVATFNLPAIAAAFVVPFFYARPSPQVMRFVALAGFFAGAGLACYAMGLVLTTVVRATLLFYLMPIWSTLLAIVFLGERTGAARWIALALGFAGLALTLGASPSDIVGNFGLGEAFGLVSGILWSCAAVMIRRIGETGEASAAVDVRLVLHQFFWTILVAGGAAMALGAPAPAAALVAEAMTPMVVIFSLMILASLYAIFWAVGRLSPGRSGLLMMSEVVVAVISASLLIPEEAMNAREWIGAALIVSAGVVEVFGGAPKAQS
ncbi:MAG: DMT family transporter, partial [Pseudomonadota bacterium]